ncbi:MAG: riboflavin synthase [Planctomycetota bacterium]|jgi:riboflavin synthase
MFTGLVEAVVAIKEFRTQGTGAVLVLPAPQKRAPDGSQWGGGPPWEVKLGDSVACSGCCLTVAALAPDGAMTFELSLETIEKTWLGQAEVGRLVNLERAMLLSDRLGGHLVSGHVDGIGSLIRSRDPGDGGLLMTFGVEPDFERWLIQKGSVTLDGISLTIVDPRPGEFDVAVIPETLVRTSLGGAKPGDAIHLEGDLVGKWIERLVGPYRVSAPA